MHMAKASEADLSTLRDFFNMLEEVIEYGTHEDVELRDPDSCWELVEEKWNSRPGVGCSWRRVVEGCDMLIQNVCDPDVTHLALNPRLENLEAENAKLREALEKTKVNLRHCRDVLFDCTEDKTDEE